MLRIAIGALGVLLIGLGFSNDDTLSWVTQRVAAPFSSAPDSGVLSTADSAVAPLETVSSALEDVRSTVETIADGGGLIEGEEVVAPVASGEIPQPQALPVTTENTAAVESQIEIVPAVAAPDPVAASASVATPGNAIDAVLKKNAYSIEDDTLYVLKSQVNLRGGPSIEHDIILRLDQGQELMEFKRDGKWVHVGAYGTEGTVGWVHQSLVGAQQQ